MRVVTLLVLALLLVCCDHVIADGHSGGHSSSSHSTSSSPMSSGGITTSHEDLLVIIGPILALAIIVCCLRESSWSRKIQKAEQAVIRDAAKMKQQPGSRHGDTLPETVEFVACYTDSSMRGGRIGILASGTLEVSSSDKGGSSKTRSIAGYGRDEDDGYFSIIQGAISPSGKCYWLEETSVTNSRQVLVTGSFVPNENGYLIFKGKLKSNSGSYGKFASFDLKPEVHISDAPKTTHSADPLKTDNNRNLLTDANHTTPSLMPEGNENLVALVDECQSSASSSSSIV